VGLGAGQAGWHGDDLVIAEVERSRETDLHHLPQRLTPQEMLPAPSLISQVGYDLPLCVMVDLAEELWEFVLEELAEREAVVVGRSP
jgi:hypothetical protein